MGIEHIYNECRNKYGWCDGDEQPGGIYEARDALVRLINRHLPSDCPVEAYSLDRPSMHNGALLLFREKGLTAEQALDKEEPPEPDEIGRILSDAEESGELVIDLKCEIFEAEVPKPRKSRKRSRSGGGMSP